MRSAIPLLLLSMLAFAGDPPPDFEVTLPEGDEWEAMEPDHEGVKAYFKTEFADTPGAAAEVRVMTYPLSTAFATKALDAIAHDWAPTVESRFKDPTRVDEGASKLGSEEAWSRDVRTASARLTWHVARAGKVLYVFHVIRTAKAMTDEGVEQQIAGMRTGFRFPKASAPDPAAPPEPPLVKEEKEEAPRETLAFDYWRFECTKPLGLLQVPPEKLDKAETDGGVVAKFERTDGQARIMVRIYAQSRGAERFTIEELAEQKLKRFEGTYDETHRNPPKRDDAWKVPLAERAILLELTGRKRTIEITRWVLAECKNDRQYQIEIWTSGGDAERWSPEIKDLLDGFRPRRG